MIKDERYYKAYMESRTISRRGLFRGLLKGAQPLDAYSSTLPATTAIRPPGAVAENLFLQRCTGCHACADACGESLIVMVNQRPELDFSTQYCGRCHACNTACQTGALSHSSYAIAARPVVKNTCQNSYLYCDSCADYCERQALQWQTQQPPRLIDDLCDGCGECTFRCPAVALEMQLIEQK